MARKEASCSTGWWVGPSSPSPMASWVKTKSQAASSGRKVEWPARVIAEDKEGGAESRSFDRESPLTMATIACSRRPKCRFLPPKAPGRSPRLLRTSARFWWTRRDPPIRPAATGTFCASTLSTLPEASRPATPFGSAEMWAAPHPSARQLTALHQIYLERELWIC